MFIEWYEKWLTLRLNYKQASKPVCDSCEVLRTFLNQANHEKEILLNKLLNKEEPKQDKVPDNLVPIRPKNHLPMRVKQEMMMEQDMKAIDLMKKSRLEMKPADTSELEKELEIVSNEKKNAR